MMLNVERDLNGNVKYKKFFIWFFEDLIICEIVFGQDIIEELELIVQSLEKIDVNCLNEYGYIVLSMVVFVGSMKCCRIFVEFGVEVGKQDEDGWIVMYYVMVKGYLDIVKYLVMCGGDLFVKNNDGDVLLDFVEDNEIKEIFLVSYEKYLQSKFEV